MYIFHNLKESACSTVNSRKLSGRDSISEIIQIKIIVVYDLIFAISVKKLFKNLSDFF